MDQFFATTARLHTTGSNGHFMARRMFISSLVHLSTMIDDFVLFSVDNVGAALFESFIRYKGK